MLPERYSQLTGKQKAAILLVTLGPERSAQIYKFLSEEEIEDLTLEVANLGKISPEFRDQVLEEFHQMCIAQEYITKGGVDYAREILQKALGPEKAQEVISRLSTSLQVSPFDFARKTDPSQILSFIQGEHPQTIALIIAYLNPEQAAMILSALPQNLQTEVAMRIATMDRTSPEVIKEVERVLEKKITTLTSSDYTSAGGIKSLVEILNRVDRSTEKSILEELGEKNPDLAEEVKRLMFTFEDIISLDDRSIQRVLRDIDSKDLALALKGANEDVKKKIFKNMSERAQQVLKEELEYIGPVRLRNVEEAQQRIVNSIRRLEETGEIVIARGRGEEIVI